MGSITTENLWKEACFITRLVASSVCISETAGGLIKVFYIKIIGYDSGCEASGTIAVSTSTTKWSHKGFSEQTILLT